MNLVEEVLGAAAPVIGAGRPQPPSAPIPPEQIAGHVAAWLLRIGCRADLHAAGPALRVAAVLARREAAGEVPLSGRELGAVLPPKVVDGGLRSLRIVGAVRQEVLPVDSRAVAYRPTGQMRPARGALADPRRLAWLHRAAVNAGLPDVAIRLALLAGASWPWEASQRPPEASGLATRLGVDRDVVVAAWAALVRVGLLRAGTDAGGHPTLAIVDRAPARAKDRA